MNIGLYVGAAAMGALDRWQETIAHNMAASSNPGYRKRAISFVIEPAGQIATGGAKTARTQAVQYPTTRSGYSFVSGETIDTGRDLDLAIQGEGFFEVLAPNGERIFTRAGSFHLSADRTIVDNQGRALLGDGGAPMQLLSTGGTVSISRDGTLTQGEQSIGRIPLYRFDNPQALRAVSGAGFVPEGQPPLVVEVPEIVQGSVETSNVKAVDEMVNLVQVSRAYEAAQKIVSTRDELLDKTLRTFI